MKTSKVGRVVGCLWAITIAAGCGSPVAVGGDAGAVEDGGRDGGRLADAAVDAAIIVDDGGRDAATSETDAAAADDAAEVVDAGCRAIAPSYTCTADPGTCPGGTCISAWCLGPDVDPDRWVSCGDGTCTDCERDPGCGIDCGTTPRTGMPLFDASTTITLKLHGLSVGTPGSLDDRIFGEVMTDRELEMSLRTFAPDLPHGLTEPTSPTQLVSVDFYGTHPAAWLSAAEIAEIEAHDAHGEEAIERYALVVGIFLEHRLAEAGATGVNILCHSMGCHVTRFLIEHDVRGLASSGRIVRVVSVAGALNGAGLADMFDNPSLREYAVASPIQTSDFTHLDPDYATDHAALWDHRLYEANSPMWTGISIHEITGSDPVAAAGVFRPLDLTNPTDEPNDSILYARDTYFTAQDPSVRFVALDGSRPMPSHTWSHGTHPQMEEDLGAVAVATAALFHHRRVTITLRATTLLDDHERPGGFTTFGEPPADLACDVRVSYDPYLVDTFGVTGALINEQTVGHRSAPFFQMREGETVSADVVLFDAPVFDDQTSLHFAFDLREVDRYAHHGVNELPTGDGSVLGSLDRDLPIVDATYAIETEDVRATVEVRVVTLF